MGLALILVGVGVVLCWFRHSILVGGWLATAVWLVSLPMLWHAWSLRWQQSVWDFSPLVQRWERWGPYGLVTLLVLVALWPLSLGVVPISQDHANHYLATHIFLNDFLSQGQLFGWTDRISSGLPFGDVYGTLVYTVTAALSFVSMGAVPLSTSYALGIVFVWWLPAMAVVAWTRRLTPGVWPAVIAAGLLVMDPGGDREGGWIYSMFHGVWPQLLATGIALWALLSLFRLMERQTWRRLCVTATTVGLALWAHPMNAITLLLGSVLAVVVVALERPESNEEGGEQASWMSLHRGVLWCVVGLGIGGTIGWLWLSRLFVAAPAMEQFSATWKSLHDLTLHLMQGRLFDHSITLFSLFSLLGVVVLWRRPSREGRWVLAYASALLVLGSAELILSVDGGVHPRHGLFMFRRLTVTLKPLWFIFAGVGLAAVLQALISLSSRRPSFRADRIFVLVLAAPLVWSTFVSLPRLFPSPVARVLTAQNTKLQPHLEQLRKAMRSERKRFPKRRLRMVQWRGGAGSYGLFLVADENWAYLPTGKPPCQALKYINAYPNDRMLRWMGATHVFSHIPRELPGTQLVTKAGKFYLYRILKAPSPPYRLEGAGTVRLVKWSKLKRVFEVKGVTPKSRLVVGVPPYQKWRYSQGEGWRKVRKYREQGYAFASLQPLRDGTVTMAYHDTFGEVVAMWVGLFLLGLCLVGVIWGRGFLPELFPLLLVRSVGPLSKFALVVGGVGLWLAGQSIGTTALNHEFAEKEYPSVVDVLHHPRGLHFSVAPKPLCLRPFSRNPRPSCHEWYYQPKRVAGPVRGKSMPTCLQFGVPHEGKAELSFAISPQARLLKGRIHGMKKDSQRLFLVGGKVHTVGAGKVFRIPLLGKSRRVKLIVVNRGRTRTSCLELVTLQAKN